MTNEMTAEEAVEILKYERDNDIFVATEYREKLHEALTKAIKALEQQPSEDCISREHAKQFLYYEIEHLHDDGLYDCFARIIDDMYNELPSVIPQTVTEFADKCKECGKIQNEFFNFDAPMVKNSEAVSREAVIKNIKGWFDKIELNPDILIDSIVTLPSVTPKYTDEEIDKAQAVEQAYVDKMVELAVEESRKKWLNSFDTSSATKCFEAVNLLKQRLEGEE